MKLTSAPSVKETLPSALKECRCKTLDLFKDLDHHRFCQQNHPDFSPPGWHLGHIGFAEAYWILERCGGKPKTFPQYLKLFAADGLPKAERQNLPEFSEIKAYLEVIRTKVLDYLETAPLEKEERLWRWLIQHESQHSETITFVLELEKKKKPSPLITIPGAVKQEMCEIERGSFMMGNDNIEAQDNEKPAHQVYLDKYWIDKYPVTCGQYREFIKAEGYDQPKWWTKQGWKWLKANGIKQPQYWNDSREWSNHPVCGVSYHEAEAYAKFVGKRLPTEAEWEKAATGSKPANYDLLVGETTPVNSNPDSSSIYGCCHMLGNVWEWTGSLFESYPGFFSYPYTGYSMAYFDGQHRVLKGGSWATRPWALRNSFRNWYYPEVRQILAGFRCVSY